MGFLSALRKRGDNGEASVPKDLAKKQREVGLLGSTALHFAASWLKNHPKWPTSWGKTLRILAGRLGQHVIFCMLFFGTLWKGLSFSEKKGL